MNFRNLCRFAAIPFLVISMMLLAAPTGGQAAEVVITVGGLGSDCANLTQAGAEVEAGAFSGRGLNGKDLAADNVDLVFKLEGSFRDSFEISGWTTSPSCRLTITGADGLSYPCIFSDDGTGYAITAASTNVVLSGISVLENSPSSTGSALQVFAGDITVADCILETRSESGQPQCAAVSGANAGFDGCAFSGGIGVVASSGAGGLAISNSTFVDMRYYGCYILQASDVKINNNRFLNGLECSEILHLENTGDVLVYNNLFNAGLVTGDAVYFSVNSSNTESIIVNNTVAGSAWPGSFGLHVRGAEHGLVHVKNNLVYIDGQSTGLFYESSDVATLLSNNNNVYLAGAYGSFGRYDDFEYITQADWTAATGMDTHSYENDPDFISLDPSSPFWLHIMRNSPCLGRGTSEFANVFDYEIDYRPHLSDSWWAIGADEPSFGIYALSCARGAHDTPAEPVADGGWSDNAQVHFTWTKFYDVWGTFWYFGQSPPSGPGDYADFVYDGPLDSPPMTSEGTYYLYMKAYDGTENTSEYSFCIRYDSTAPDSLEIRAWTDAGKTLEISNASARLDRTPVYFEWSHTDALSGPDETSWLYYWGTDASAGPDTQISENNVELACPSAGTYYLKVRAFDVAGNHRTGSFVYLYDDAPQPPGFLEITCRAGEYGSGGPLITNESWTGETVVHFSWTLNDYSLGVYWYFGPNPDPPSIDFSEFTADNHTMLLNSEIDVNYFYAIASSGSANSTEHVFVFKFDPAAPQQPDPCYVDGKINPAGLQNPAPLFSAKYLDFHGNFANAAAVTVSLAEDGTAVFDSGWVAITLTDAGDNSPAVQYNSAVPLEPGTTYTWRIRFMDLAGNPGLWSENQSFSTAASFTPLPACNPDPPDGGSGLSTSKDLTWNVPADADGCRLYFGTSAAALSNTGEFSAGYYDPGPLTAGTTYYWRVDTFNSNGETTGATWSFTTIFMPDLLPGQASNPVPADCAPAVAQTADLSWDAAPGADGYILYMGESSGAFENMGVVFAATYEPGILQARTEYRWRVDSFNSHGTTTGELWRFTTSTTRRSDSWCAMSDSPPETGDFAGRFLPFILLSLSILVLRRRR